MLPIQKMLISHNYSTRQDTIKYIVIHDTGNEDEGANVKAHFNYFNDGNRNASADYFVDEKTIGQFVEDHNKSWHCGDGYGKYGITNNNSIGVELCVNRDGNREIAKQNLISLVKYLMIKYDLGIDRVVRHYDASRKNCPQSMSANNWSEWHELKAKILGQAVSKPVEQQVSGLVATVTASELNVRSGASTNFERIGKVFNGEKVECLDIINSWFYIKYDTSNGKKCGWVSGNYLNKSFRVGEITASVLNVRAGAGTGYNVIGSLNKGEKAMIKQTKNGWANIVYDTSHGAKVGWVSCNYLQ